MLRENVLDMPTAVFALHYTPIQATLGSMHRSSVSVTALQLSLPWNLFHHVKANTHLVNR